MNFENYLYLFFTIALIYFLIIIYLYTNNYDKLKEYLNQLKLNYKMLLLFIAIINFLRFIYFYTSHDDFIFQQFCYIILFSVIYLLLINLILFLSEEKRNKLIIYIQNLKIIQFYCKIHEIFFNYFGNKFVTNIYLFILNYNYYEEFFDFSVIYDKYIIKYNNFLEKYFDYFVLFLFWIYLIISMFLIQNSLYGIILLLFIFYIFFNFPFLFYYKLNLIHNNIIDYYQNNSELKNEFILRMGILDDMFNKGGFKITKIATPSAKKFTVAQGLKYAKKVSPAFAIIGGISAVGAFGVRYYFDSSNSESQQRIEESQQRMEQDQKEHNKGMEERDAQYKQNMEQIAKDKVTQDQKHQQRMEQITKDFSESQRKILEENRKNSGWFK